MRHLWQVKRKHPFMIMPIVWLIFSSLASWPLLGASVESLTAAVSLDLPPLDLPPNKPSPGGAVYVMGHLSPDTDSIMAAIALAHLIGGIPARSGPINKETAYLLKRFKLPTPELITATAAKKFFLVDFNQRTQAPSTLEGGQIVGILDHHALQEASFATPQPIPIIIKPWGSTCTIIAALFAERKVKLTPALAQALLAGILSDTLALQSPTTTPADRQALGRLAPMAHIADPLALAHQMFAAKSDLGDLSSEELVVSDFKTFQLAGHEVGFGVIETISPNDLAWREAELRSALRTVKVSKKLQYLFLAIINPLTKQSYLLLPTEEDIQLAIAAFKQPLRKGRIDTSPLVSRKKEFLPPLSSFLQQPSRPAALVAKGQ